jgi:hypothetical protein
VSSRGRRRHDWNDLPLVATVDSKVLTIHGHDRMARVQLAHANQAHVSQIQAPVAIALCQNLELRQVKRTLIV